MRKYDTLISADIYREGGSLEARFVRNDGRFETVRLKARPESRQMDRFIYVELLLFDNADAEGEAKAIVKSSTEELEIIAALREFLDHPKIDIPFAHSTPKKNFLRVVESLVSCIPGRTAMENWNESVGR
jgi:hypothetical protein